MNVGIFRLAPLFIAGTTRAWYLYLVYSVLGAVLLLSTWSGRQAGDLSSAIQFAAVFNAVMWLIATVGMVATVRELRGLCPPHLHRQATKVLGLAALLTLMLPTALLVLSGSAAFHVEEIRQVFMTLAFGAAVGMLIATLPLPIVGVGFAFGVPVLAAFPDVRLQLTQTAFWQSTWHMEAVTVLALCIVVWQCRALILSEKTGGPAWGSLAQLRAIAPKVMLAAAQDANTVYRIGPAWMLPSGRIAADASLWTRISTLMGPPFAPGYLRQILSVFAFTGVIVALFMWFFVHRLPERISPEMFLTSMKSQVPMVFLLVLFPIARTFAGRLRMFHRPQSAELAELALLPGLGGGRSTLANYALVIFGRPLRMVAIISAVLGTLAVVLLRIPPWSLLIWGQFVAGFTLLESGRFLAAGRPYMRSIFIEVLIHTVVTLGIAALAFVSGLPAMFDAQSTGPVPRMPDGILLAANTISHFVIPTFVVGVSLAAIYSVRRAYAKARQLPHPFLDAEERRVVAFSVRG